MSDWKTLVRISFAIYFIMVLSNGDVRSALLGSLTVPPPLCWGSIQTLVRTNAGRAKSYQLYPFPMRRFTGVNDVIIFKNGSTVACTPLFYTDASAAPQMQRLVIEGQLEFQVKRGQDTEIYEIVGGESSGMTLQACENDLSDLRNFRVSLCLQRVEALLVPGDGPEL